MDAAQTMETWIPTATCQEIVQYNDVCVICMEKLTHAKKLQCNHLFHAECLQTWIRQEPSCPKCRQPLQIQVEKAEKAEIEQDREEDEIEQVRRTQEALMSAAADRNTLSHR